jgi:hypothetical protein
MCQIATPKVKIILKCYYSDLIRNCKSVKQLTYVFARPERKYVADFLPPETNFNSACGCMFVSLLLQHFCHLFRLMRHFCMTAVTLDTSRFHFK